jgi:uroporphyrinogen-III synthase
LSEAQSVLITRPAASAEETAARVRELGFRPVIAPLLTIVPIPAKLPEDAAAVLITSGNAVPELPPWARHRPVFAVGAATASRARQAGCIHVHSADGDAAALVTLVGESVPPYGHILLLTGKDQGGTLAAALEQHFPGVIRCEVYEAMPVATLPDPARAALRTGELAAALFFSAETARCFIRLVTAEHLEPAVRHTHACAIGRAAAVALEALPWRQIRIAARPNHDEMLILLR